MIIPNITIFNSSVLLQERNIKVHYPEFYQFLIDNYNIYPGNTIQEQMYMYYNDIHEPYKCETCGNPTKFLSFHKGYRRFCCGKCTTSDPNRMEKTKQTWINMYGTKYKEKFNEKAKQTKLDRYGDADYNNLEKAKQTKLDRYGDANYNNLEKAKQTCIEKYGEDYHKKFIDKSKQTKLERYGDTNYNNVDKSKQTCLERYGVSNPMQSKTIQERAKSTNLKRYGVEWGILNKHIRDKNELSRRRFYIEKHNLNDINDDGIWICKCPHPGCNKCEEKCYEITSIHFYGRKQMNIEPCTNLLPISPNINTNIERFVKNILDIHDIEYQTNIRSIISPKELDIYIPSKQIAIECNGVYWHSHKESLYHINKYKECQQKEIQLLTLWEDWIKTKPEIVESILLNKLGLCNNTIYARKTIIKEIDSNTCSNFLNINHIQGRTNAAIKLGLYYRGELVSVMTFSKKSKLSGSKHTNKSEYELSRFCNKLNIRVIGGASKLLKYFIKTYNPKTIISFASNDISNGNLYKELGFVSDNKITSAYWYIHKKELIRYHRTSFTKTRLKEMGYDIDNKTESRIMSELPYWKIYDSGHIKYILNV